MSKKNRDRECLIDIYNCGHKVIRFTNDITKDDLKTDEKTLDAILYNIQIIGEAAKKLSLNFRSANSHIPWKDITGMRDKIVHDYKKINLDIVWNVVKQGIPKLLKEIEELLPER